VVQEVTKRCSRYTIADDPQGLSGASAGWKVLARCFGIL
jgi:hypothetical protein